MITAIDHIVLTSADVDKTIAFYCDVLGMELQTFSPPDGSAPRCALCFGRQKINIHDGAAPYVPHARNPVSGAVDICLLSDYPSPTGSAALPITASPSNTGRLRKRARRDLSGRSMCAIRTAI